MKNRILLDNYYLPGQLEQSIEEFVRYCNEYERAMNQLKKEKLIRQVSWRDGERGPVKEGWAAVSDEDR